MPVIPATPEYVKAYETYMFSIWSIVWGQIGHAYAVGCWVRGWWVDPKENVHSWQSPG